MIMINGNDDCDGKQNVLAQFAERGIKPGNLLKFAPRSTLRFTQDVVFMLIDADENIFASTDECATNNRRGRSCFITIYLLDAERTTSLFVNTDDFDVFA